MQSQFILMNDIKKGSVAMDTGIPVNVLGSIEARKQPATWEHLEKLVMYYGCSVSDLI